MLYNACQAFLGKTEEEVRQIATETLEGHQRAIMGNMTVEVCTSNRNHGNQATENHRKQVPCPAQHQAAYVTPPQMCRRLSLAV